MGLLLLFTKGEIGASLVWGGGAVSGGGLVFFQRGEKLISNFGHFDGTGDGVFFLKGEEKE